MVTNQRVMVRAWLAAAVATSLAVAPRAAYGHAIGHVSVTYTDPTRGNRQVPSQVYYPADTPGTGVPVATPPPGGFPVVTFGHGFLLSYSLYAFVWEGLVPQGYIVALPTTETGLLPDHLELGRDLAFLVRALRQEGAFPGSLFYGAVAPTAAVMGHSMGGGASFLAAADDSSITALANFAAAETNPSAIGAAGGLGLPALLFSASHDCVTPPESHQIPMYEALASLCKTWVSLTGGSHCQFAASSYICELGEGGCLDPTITRATQHELTLTLLVPWLDYVLRGESASWTLFQERLSGLAGVTYDQRCVLTTVTADPMAPPRTGSPGGEGRALLLAAPVPNPAAGHMGIHYYLPRSTSVSIAVYDPAGRRVRTLCDGPTPAGWNETVWDGRDERGRPVASGFYLCVGESQGERAAEPILLLR